MLDRWRTRCSAWWVVALLWTALFSLPALAQSWDLRYFYDDVDERLYFVDLVFASAQRGVGVGLVVDEDAGREKDPVAVVSSDGGETWDRLKLDDYPLSLFFLDDSVGWMVGEKGLWKTLESGRTWKRVSKHGRGEIRRVWFFNEQHGFAVGEEARVLETHDGGVNWDPVTLPEELPKDTLFSQIVFSGNQGMIIGHVGGTLALRRPLWIYPELFEKLPRIAHKTIELRTANGGASWVVSKANLSGTIREVALELGNPNATELNDANSNNRKSGRRRAPSVADSLVLITYEQPYRAPSAVVHVDLNAPNKTTTFSESHRLFSSVRLFPPQVGGGPRGFLAGVEPPGEIPLLPIPGRVVVYQSEDLNHWEPMEVDYRADAHSVVLAGSSPQNLWMATDTGMILHLVPEGDDPAKKGTGGEIPSLRDSTSPPKLEETPE